MNKKRLTTLLFVVCISITCLFAGTSTVNVISKVNTISIREANSKTTIGLYKLSFDDSALISDVSNYQMSSISISQEDVVTNVSIIQTALTRTNESINLSITANPLSFTDANNDTYSTEFPTFTEWGNSSYGEDYYVTEVAGQGTNSVQVGLKYQDEELDVPAGAKIGSFTVTWPKNEALALHPGIYVANIEMTFTIN